jgi:Caspase domain/Putative ATP-dependent DNA helicase recG C-terminal
VYRALIVCNYRFPAAQGSLRDLQGPKRDGLLLRDALTDHDTGMFEKANVRDPLNDATSGEILEAVEEFFESAEPDDTLLFYYSGHGRSRDQELYLCAQNTDLSRLRSTAVSGRVLKDIVGSSSSLARAKILVFDCCYSALFKGDDDREFSEMFGTGRYVLAATSAAERAADSAQKGVPSPFTKALADALLKQAEDLDGDGKVDLDDVYRYLKTISFDGARPHQNFEGAGTVPIARRATPAARDEPQAGLPDHAARARAENSLGDTPTGRDRFSAARDLYITYPSAFPGFDVPYLDRPVPGASFSPALVAEFRKGMRDDVRERMPDSLTDAHFLDRTGLLARDGSITYAGLLLFGAHPTQALPSAVLQCVRFHGTTNTAPREITDFHDPIPQLIARAYDFVAGVARTGDTPTDSGPRAEPAYRYPMVAVREIIANAVVHRDYENQKSCVQIHAFEDRIEVHSPGTWQGAAVAPGAHPLGELARTSERRNFRIAQPLTWSRLMEGAGTGVARSVEECGKAGAQEPLVTIDEASVKVTIFPRPPRVMLTTDSSLAQAVSWPGGAGLNSQNPAFFLSYARTGSVGKRADEMVKRFFLDLSQNLSALIALPAGQGIGFIDLAKTSETSWDQDLLTALGACQVFIPLLSVPYLRSAWSGKEWHAFSRRAKSESRVANILPVRWAPIPEHYQIPSIVQEIQFFYPKNTQANPELIHEYVTEGLFGLMRSGEEGVYEEIVWQISLSIQELYYNGNIYPMVSKVDDLVDLFERGSEPDSPRK